MNSNTYIHRYIYIWQVPTSTRRRNEYNSSRYPRNIQIYTSIHESLTFFCSFSISNRVLFDQKQKAKSKCRICLYYFISTVTQTMYICFIYRKGLIRSKRITFLAQVMYEKMSSLPALLGDCGDCGQWQSELQLFLHERQPCNIGGEFLAKLIHSSSCSANL